MTLEKLTCSVTQEVVGPTYAKQSLVKRIKLCSYLIQPVRLSVSSTKHLSMHWLCCFKQGKRIGLQAKASSQISQKLHKSQSHKVRQNEVHSVINFRIFLAQKTKKKKKISNLHFQYCILRSQNAGKNLEGHLGAGRWQ